MNADPEGSPGHLPLAAHRYHSVRDELRRFSERLNEAADEFADLFHGPVHVRDYLRSPTSIFWRFFRDRLVFENKWWAAPV